MPTGRYEWERVVRRIVMPPNIKLLAFAMATYADPDGSRVRPGVDVLAAVVGQSDSTVRRSLAVLRTKLGLLDQTTRGGGRNGRGKTAEYQLTIPADLLDRVDLLTPDGHPPVTQVNGHSVNSPVIQTTGQTIGTPVDNSESEFTQVTAQSEASPGNDRSQETGENGMTGQKTGMSGHLGDQLPIDQPPKETNTRPPVPAQLTTAREPTTLDDFLPLSKPSRPDPGPKCGHGLDAGCDDTGQPRCPLCRREAPAATRAAS
jgi:hypothetical protein